MTRKLLTTVVVLMLCTPIAEAFGSPRFNAILLDESPRTVKLGTIEPTGSDLLDVDEGWFTIQPGGCLAVIRQDPWTLRPSRMRITLHDGQIFPGELVFGDQDRIQIDHLWMRKLDIPIDRISLIEFRSGTEVPPGESDRVVLVNGDVLTGFIVSIDDKVRIETGRDEIREIELPIDRVAAIAFAGESPPASWPQIWMLDGVRMTIPRVGIDASGRLDLDPHEFMLGDYERLPNADELVALILDGDRFTPLGNLPLDVIKTSVARRTNPPPVRQDPGAPIGLTNLLLGGPARYDFTIPDGTIRFRSVLERPRTSRRWPSPTVTISLGDTVLWTGQLEDPVDLDLDCTQVGGSGRLSIDIACGSQGPVHCGVRLIQPMIFQKTD